jgi:hypothetical protein
MNKKLLTGAAAVAAFIALTAFGGKTLAEQKAEIASSITSKLESYRTELQTACDEKVAAAAQTKADEIIAAKAAEVPATPTKGIAPKKKPTKGSTGGPKVDPLPQGPKPAPSDPKKDKMNETPNTSDKKEKMQEAPNTDKKKAKMQSGGGN